MNYQMRRGFTLIELLLAMCLAAAILTVVAITLGGLARADRKAHDRIDRETNVQRLTTRLRQDAHDATDWSISPEQVARISADGSITPTPPSVLRVTTLEGTIEFQPQGQRIVRTVTKEDTVMHRESYQLGAAIQTNWEVDRTQERPLITLTLEIAPSGELAAQRHEVRSALLNISTNPAE